MSRPWNLNKKIEPLSGYFKAYRDKINEIAQVFNWYCGIRSTNGYIITETARGPLIDTRPGATIPFPPSGTGGSPSSPFFPPGSVYAYPVSFQATQTFVDGLPLSLQFSPILGTSFLFTGAPLPSTLTVPSFTITAQYYTNYADPTTGEIEFVQGPTSALLSLALYGLGEVELYSTLLPATGDGNGNLSGVVPEVDMSYASFIAGFIALGDFTQPPSNLVAISGYQNIPLISLPNTTIIL